MSSTSRYSLQNLDLPELFKIEDLASKIRLSLSKIVYLTYRTNFLYKIYGIRKKNGEDRIIAEPNRDLKAVQSWILRNILDKLSTSLQSKGFDIKSSILKNALPHRGNNYLLTLDLENFFPSISANKVFMIFSSVGYNKEISAVLTNLCVFDGRLPQGAPTSPKLANLVCKKLDARIQGYAGPKGIVYTRYADDISLSAKSPEKIQKTKDFIETIISGENFKINHAKTNLSGTRKQKKITGLIVSQKNVGIGREKLREIRAKIHHLFKYKSENYDQVNGLLAFTYGVDKKSYRKLYLFIEKMKAEYPTSIEANKLHNKKLRS